MKANHKVRDLALTRGLAAENRLIRIVRSLRINNPWVGKVSLAGIKHDRVGIDVFVSVKPLVGDRYTKVPVQVKSSKAGLCAHYTKYGYCLENRTLLVIVNHTYSDEELGIFLTEKLSTLRWQ